METNGPFQQPANQQPVVFKSDGSKSGGGIAMPRGSLKVVLAGFIMLFLVGGVGTGVYLVGQQQQLKSSASVSASVAPIPTPLAQKAASPSAHLGIDISTPDSTPEVDLSAPSMTPFPNPSPPPEASRGAQPIEQPLISPPTATESGQPTDNPGQNGNQYDFNSDGAINSADLSVMYSAWGTPKTDLQKKADINNDGIVNGLDYSAFLQHFNEKISE